MELAGDRIDRFDIEDIEDAGVDRENWCKPITRPQSLADWPEDKIIRVAPKPTPVKKPRRFQGERRTFAIGQVSDDF